MPAPIVPKDEVLRRLTQAFRRVGYEGATLSLLSKETGLKKASLYHYFPGGKKDMAEAALGEVGRAIQSSIFSKLEGAGTPRKRLERMLEAVEEFYDSGKRWCLFDLFSVGNAGELFAEPLSAAVDAWLEKLRDLALEEGVSQERATRQAEEAMITLQGSLVVARAQQRPAIFRRALWGIPDRLLCKS